ncbi:hypothetical protein D9757_000614 [Collybiopsis confluens]|uniref:Transmembrane 9 superfamily member n=1 Tax=Collybiopsis confluens TaxID=2823264 RepID=A0A8H5MGS2_9AGAR|nr:hypothetical protein D9757_000614 [Collybiopsis confluens]
MLIPLAFAGSFALSAYAFYLPGAAPSNFAKGGQVDLFVNALTPMFSGGNDAKLKSLINYDYYNPKFQFCPPEGGPVKQSETLGGILFGDRIFNSPFDIKMLENNQTCQDLCKSTVDPESARFINERIREDYALNWLVDGLPAAEMKVDLRTGETFYDIGFNLGNDDESFEEVPALNNHYEIVLRYTIPFSNTPGLFLHPFARYHEYSPGVYRIVGVLVWPYSIGGDQDGAATCDTDNVNSLVLSESSTQTVRYTYRVTWNVSSTPWATRWDNYLKIADPRIHWFSLVNSIVIVIFLLVMVSMILLRSVSRDISRYNAIDLSEDVQEDFGWKLVHGEVFRSPSRPMLLAILSGNGTQLCSMVGVTLVFALLGFLSPSNRGSLATVMLVFFSLFGYIGGYVSGRLYASLGGTDKRKNAFLTATGLPTLVFMIVFLLNFFLIIANSSGAVPFGTLLVIALLWFGISAPLSAVGSYFGSKHGAIHHPVRVNSIPRQIPPGPKYLRPWSAALLGGILPFGAAFVELYFVMSSLFASKAYYAFAGVMGVTVATVSILFTYFMLCAEEYRWQWRSFLVGGGNAFWVLAYGIFYWVSRLSLDSFASVALYMGYLILLALLDFLVTGAIGFLASYWAVRRLYSAIRID